MSDIGRREREKEMNREKRRNFSEIDREREEE